jgi:hypothetical protein
MKEAKLQGLQRTIKPRGMQRQILLHRFTSSSRRSSGKCACTPRQPSTAAAAAATAAEEVIAIIEEPQQPRNSNVPPANVTLGARQSAAAATAGSDSKEPLYKVGLSSSMVPRPVGLAADSVAGSSKFYRKTAHACCDRSGRAQLQASAQLLVTIGGASKSMCSTTAAAALLCSAFLAVH